ncbi:aldo/keto reductase [Prochlorococcus sp. MIT 1307]|uniref:aldo/keto reductase n=1 Tax=Prochlorococcus sp. MIT 1307 TaxID=3096219 RepID=UPI002A75FF65|nr:aldo/keto reductase [Prochlorococcus sp. MIT 1307]
MIKEKEPSTNLCLGTAQFGMNYGISNKKGIIRRKEIIEIVQLIIKNDIKYIDTAQSYGSAEGIIGELVPKCSPIKIITKINTDGFNIKNNNFTLELDSSLKKSLLDLKRDNIEGLLIHDCSIFKKSGCKDLINWLLSIKRKGLVKKIGVSIYSEKDLESVPLSHIDIVQLPISIYDQRLLKNGTISKMKKKGIEIQARSIFLQGLLLQAMSDWPSFISNDFRDHHGRFANYLKGKNISLLEASLDFVKSIKHIKTILVGISSKEDFENILLIWKKVQSKLDNTMSYSQWSWEDSTFLDPRAWPKRS